jgi:hypothetical protein
VTFERLVTALMVVAGNPAPEIEVVKVGADPLSKNVKSRANSGVQHRSPDQVTLQTEVISRITKAHDRGVSIDLGTPMRC